MQFRGCANGSLRLTDIKATFAAMRDEPPVDLQGAQRQ